MRNVTLLVTASLLIPFAVGAQAPQERARDLSAEELVSRFANDLVTSPTQSSRLETVLASILLDRPESSRADSVVIGLKELAMGHSSSRVRSLATTLLITGSDGPGQSGRSVIRHIQEIYESPLEMALQLSILSAVPHLPARDRQLGVEWMETLATTETEDLRFPTEAEDAVRALSGLPGGKASLERLLKADLITDPRAIAIANLLVAG